MTTPDSCDTPIAPMAPSSGAQTVWLCRHANRIDFVDPSRRCADPCLSDDGIVQARETGARLRGEPIACVFASPFVRAVETAHYIAEALAVPIRIEAGVCEWLNAAWFPTRPDWVPPDTLKARFPRIDRSYRSQVQPRFPETPDEMLARCRDAAGCLLESCRMDFLVVGHGASVAGLLQALLGRKPPTSCCAVCALSKVVHRGGPPTLELYGDTSHLSTGDLHGGRPR